ncbi:hypothetical protein BJ741DRAFT_662355 [Chytriomyces cf. hyalinus JEL632]|nr:hypothetical protein BJ741DRAFT_662355 [Chytriomyces cf. hyalinus JEL632]
MPLPSTNCIRWTPDFYNGSASCLPPSYALNDCYFLTTGRTSLLAENGSLYLTTSDYDYTTGLFLSNASSLWSYNARNEIQLYGDWALSMTTPNVLFLSSEYSDDACYAAYAPSTASPLRGLCVQDTEPFLSVMFMDGTSSWNYTQPFTCGALPYTKGPTPSARMSSSGKDTASTRIPRTSDSSSSRPSSPSFNRSGSTSSSESTANMWLGIAAGVGGLVLLSALAARLSPSYSKPAEEESVPQPVIFMPENDTELLPMYREREEMGVAPTPTTQPYETWTVEEVGAWFLLHGGGSQSFQVAINEQLDGRTLKAREAEDIMRAFVFDSDEQRQQVKNTLVALKGSR